MTKEKRNTLMAFLVITSMLFGMLLGCIGTAVAIPTQSVGFTTTPATNATVGLSYTYSPSIGRALIVNESFGTIQIPSWAVLNGAGTITGVPHSPGVYDFRIIASRYVFTNSFPTPYSILYTFAYQNWTVTVDSLQEFISSPILTGTVGVNYTYTPVLNEDIPAMVMIGAMLFPSWAHWNGIEIYGTPTQGGSYSFSLAANQYVYTGNFPVPYAILNTFEYQNWTVIIGGDPVPNFINPPESPVIMTVGETFSYQIDVDIDADVTILGAPTWLDLDSGNITGKATNIGRYRVILYAISNDFNTTNTLVFDIKVNPVAWPSIPVPPVWETVIPVFFLIVAMIISSISPAGISKDVFMYSGAIGITLLTWAQCFPIWALVIPAIILVVQFYQTRTDQGA